MIDIFKPQQLTKKDLIEALEPLPDHASIYIGTDQMVSLGKLDIETMQCDSIKKDCPGIILFKRGSYKWAAKMVFKPDSKDKSIGEKLADDKIERLIDKATVEASKLLRTIFNGENK